MIDDFAKEYLHGDLRYVREAMIWKLDGLAEYDVRRPLTPSSTNLLGLIKHLTITEAWYFGEVFGRPVPERLPWQDDDADRSDDAKVAALFEYRLKLDDMWVTADESRVEIVDRYRRVCGHSDATIAALDIDAPGHVSWWPRPDVKLFNILVHVLNETNRHAGLNPRSPTRQSAIGRDCVASQDARSAYSGCSAMNSATYQHSALAGRLLARTSSSAYRTS